MASRDSLEMKKLAAVGKVVNRGDDQSVAIRIRYIGTAGTPSIVMTTATKVALTDATATVDYTFAGGAGFYGNMGLLVDGINASGLWEAKLLDALRADVTTSSNFKSNTTITPGTDENGVVVWDLITDNNVTLSATACLSPFANFDAPKGHQVQVTGLSFNQDVGTAATSSYSLYRRYKNNTEVLLYTTVGLTDATNTDIEWAAGNGFISGGEDYDMIFRVLGDSITDQVANYVRIVGTIE
jgi:hypothetical protein